MTELERDLRASLAELDTEPPPPTQPADPVEHEAMQVARQHIRRARENGRLRAQLHATKDQWRGLSDYQRARIREKYVDGVGDLVRTMLRYAGVVS